MRKKMPASARKSSGPALAVDYTPDAESVTILDAPVDRFRVHEEETCELAIS